MRLVLARLITAMSGVVLAVVTYTAIEDSWIINTVLMTMIMVLLLQKPIFSGWLPLRKAALFVVGNLLIALILWFSQSELLLLVGLPMTILLSFVLKDTQASLSES